jgi:hypothetical protein
MLREMRVDDYEAIASVLTRNGLRTPTPGQWRFFWDEAPARPQLARIPMGWVAEDDTGRVVGTFRNAAFLYEWNQRPVRAVVASAWAVDPEHRRQSLGLAAEYFRQRDVDLLLNTTAVTETSGKAFLAFGAHRVPQPTYTERLLWITGYVGFAAGYLREKRLPGAAAMAYPAGMAMRAADYLRGRRRRSGAGNVRRIADFDERFDRLWSALRQQRDRLRAVRDRTTLAWRFALEREPPLIVALERDAELDGYAILVRRDQEAAGMRRMEVADLQVTGDDADGVRKVMIGALREARGQGIHLVAMSGQNDAKRRALATLEPHRKTVSGWPLYYKARDAALADALRSPDAWDMSPYDGDLLWSGVFPAVPAAA